MKLRVRQASPTALDRLVAEAQACRACIEQPTGRPLPHEPRPVVRVSATASILVCSQAPGTRVHASGLPFDDASGDRLRAWMGVTRDAFYDTGKVAFLPMGFCFPGNDAKGGDLPPRPECAMLWRARFFAALPQVRLILLIGAYAQRWHLAERFGAPWRTSLSDTVADWQRLMNEAGAPPLIALPHPSWRNNGWIRARPWFEAELLPELRRRVRDALAVNCRAG